METFVTIPNVPNELVNNPIKSGIGPLPNQESDNAQEPNLQISPFGNTTSNPLINPL